MCFHRVIPSLCITLYHVHRLWISLWITPHVHMSGQTPSGEAAIPRGDRGCCNYEGPNCDQNFPRGDSQCSNYEGQKRGQIFSGPFLRFRLPALLPMQRCLRPTLRSRNRPPGDKRPADNRGFPWELLRSSAIHGEHPPWWRGGCNLPTCLSLPVLFGLLRLAYRGKRCLSTPPAPFESPGGIELNPRRGEPHRPSLSLKVPVSM